jgi:hypothetical protein
MYPDPSLGSGWRSSDLPGLTDPAPAMGSGSIMEVILARLWHGAERGISGTGFKSFVISIKFSLNACEWPEVRWLPSGHPASSLYPYWSEPRRRRIALLTIPGVLVCA